MEISVNFPAGVTTLASRVAKIANWRDSHLIRWDDGRTLRPMNGWEEVPYSTPFASKVRVVHRWVANDGILYIAYLCDQHCYVDNGGTLLDISPTVPFAAPSGVEAGYGELDYGEDLYGTPRTGVSTIQKFSPAWTLDNWGQDLLAMTSFDGRLLSWSPSAPASKLAAVTGAPTNNRSFVVTPEHHCMLFQMGGNFGDFGWCSEEDINDWNFLSTTNTAGMYTVDPLSPIVAAQVSDTGVLICTPAMTHIAPYLGLPYVYGNEPLSAEIPIPISASAITTIPDGVIWASVEGFWLYNGVSISSIECPLWDFISKTMDFGRTVREGNFVSILNRGEVWFFWVDPSISLVANRYAALDFRSNVWMPGILSRSCGNAYGNDRNPLMSDGTKIWKHETGFSYPGAAMPWLESQTLNVGDGARLLTLTKIMPDIAGDATALAFSLAKSIDRTDYATQTYSPQRFRNEHGYVDIRETARDIRLRLDMVKPTDWSTVGPIIFDIKPRGKKK